MEMPLQKTRNGYETFFTPTELGQYLMHVNFDNKEVPESPYPVDVQAVVDLNKLEIKGLETRKLTYEFFNIL